MTVMLNWLRQVFAPSIFEDEEKTRTAQILNTFGWIAFAVVFILTLSRMISGNWLSASSRVFFPAILLILFLVQVLIRYGHVRLAGVFMVVFLWGALTFQAYNSDGIRDVAVLAYPIVILLAALLLSWREGLGIGLLSLAAIWYFAIGEQNGGRTYTFDPPVDYARDLSAVFIITSVLVYILIQRLNRSLSDARLELRERLRAEEKLRLQANYLSALHETTFGLLNRLELNPLLESILERASTLLDTPHVGIDLVLPDESALRQEMGKGAFSPWNGDLTFKGEALTGKVWELGITILAQDYLEFPQRTQEAVALGFKAVLGVPLKSGGQVLGTLLVGYTQADKKFSSEQVSLLEGLATLASLAIDNARLYEDAQTEIMERRMVEKDLRSSEERFRKVFNNRNIAISIVTLEEGTFLEANDAFWQLSGLTPEMALGHSSLEMNMWQKREDRQAFVNALLKTGSLQDVEVIFADGEQNSKTTRAFYESIEIKGQKCILCMFYDVSEQRRTEHALKESEERFRKVFQASPVAICITTLEGGRLVDANDAYWNLTGYEPETSLGRTVEELEMWDSMEARHAFVEEIKLKRSLLNPDYEFMDVKTEQLHRAIALYELIDLDGETCMLSMFYDVTERRKAEAALKSAEARTRAILYAIPDMIFEVSHDGIILDFMASSGLSPVMDPSEFIGKNIRNLFPAAIAEQTFFALERSLGSGQLHAFEYGLPPGEEVQFFEARVSAVTSRSAIMMVRDISQRKWVETEREELIRELEEKNSELERFTYTVSHDLKSPLITIKGFLGFLEQDASSGNITRLRGDLQRIADATDKMQSLLNELLQLSRIGRLVNPPQSVPFNDIVKNALDLVHGRLQANNVRVQVQDDMPVVYGDRQRMVELVQNLIDNSAKFIGPNPYIEIGHIGYENEKPIFFVRDNGIGVEPIHHDRIFGLFNKLNADSEGTGVGLALVKRIVEIHGGRIWLKSDLGKGATFFFTLPSADTHRPEPELES